MSVRVHLLKKLAESVLIPLGSTALVSATDAPIPKKLFGSGFTKWIISNKEATDIIKIVKSPEESGLLIKEVREKIKDAAKEQGKGGFLGMLLGTLGASL